MDLRRRLLRRECRDWTAWDQSEQPNAVSYPDRLERFRENDAPKTGVVWVCQWAIESAGHSVVSPNEANSGPSATSQEKPHHRERLSSIATPAVVVRHPCSMDMAMMGDGYGGLADRDSMTI